MEYKDSDGRHATTLLARLVVERNLTYQEAREALQKRAVESGLVKGGFDVSARQWQQWASGQLKTMPHPRHRRVLEAEFGYPPRQLLAAPHALPDPGR